MKYLSLLFVSMFCVGCSAAHSHPVEHSHVDETREHVINMLGPVYKELDKKTTQCAQSCLTDRNVCTVVSSLLLTALDLKEGFERGEMEKTEKEFLEKTGLHLYTEEVTKEDVPALTALIPSMNTLEAPEHCVVRFDKCSLACYQAAGSPPRW